MRRSQHDRTKTKTKTYSHSISIPKTIKRIPGHPHTELQRGEALNRARTRSPFYKYLCLTRTAAYTYYPLQTSVVV